MSGNEGLALKLISAFLKALAHKIRTPLSVISNDLSYFQSKLPQGETKQSSEKIATINNLFSKYNAIGDGELKAAQISVEELLSDLKKRRDIVVNLSSDAAFKINCDLKLMRLALELLCDTLSIARLHSGTLTLNISPNGELTISELALPAQFNPDSTLTLLFCNLLNMDADSVPLIEAILMAHGCSIKWVKNNEKLHNLVLILNK